MHSPKDELGPLLHVTKLIFKLSTLIFLGSRRNEVYAATRLAVSFNVVPFQLHSRPKRGEINMIEYTISQIGEEVGAEDCLRALV